MAKAQVFRANVGVVVCNGAGQVLALERSGRPGAWQLPQGGLDRGEEPLQAALRELREETGLAEREVELFGEHPRWLAYELPLEARSKKIGRGQVQKWFFFRLVGDAAVDLARASAGEFSAHRWVSLATLAEETWLVRRDIYRQLAEQLANLLKC